MKTARKKVFGTLGLATIAVTTGVALALPPAANAQNVQLNITIPNQNPEVTVEQPNDGAALFGAVYPIRAYYSRATKLRYQLTCKDRNGTSRSFNLPDYDTPDSTTAATHEWSLNSADYCNPAEYNFTLRVDSDGTTAHDEVSFKRTFVNANGESGNTGGGTGNNGNNGDDAVALDENGNPLIKIETDPAVDEVEIQIIDPNTGQPLTHNGQPVPPIKFKPGTDSNPFPLTQFEELGLPSGDYHIRLTPFINGQQVGDPKIIVIRYRRPEAPEVPNTGGSIFAGLNLSRSDYLISALLVFGVATFLALFILRHKAKTRRR